MSTPRNREAFEDLVNTQILQMSLARPAGSTAPWLLSAPNTDPLRALSGDEWLLARRLEALQESQDPAYATDFWNRPSPKTAHKVWDETVATFGLSLSDVGDTTWPASWNATTAEKEEHITRLMQAFTLVMAVGVNLGESHGLVTQNRMIEAVCYAWSRHWRLAVEEGRATSLFHLTPETWALCRRDLVQRRISLKKLWALLSKFSTLPRDPRVQNPFFTLEPIGQDDEDTVRSGGAYRVKLEYGAALTEFKKYILADRYKPAPHYTSPYGRFPILRSSSALTPGRTRPVYRELIAETPFNVITTGSKTNEVLDALEGATILLDGDAFEADYFGAQNVMADVETKLKKLGLGKRALSTRTKMLRGRETGTFRERAIREARKDKRLSKMQEAEVREQLARYDNAAWIVTAFKSAHEQIRATRAIASLKDLGLSLSVTSPASRLWPIRSGFHKGPNRRFQPEHFHLSAITTDAWEAEDAASSLLVQIQEASEGANIGLRFKWFRAPALPASGEQAQELVGYDCTASQIQLMALLCGLTDLEDSFKGGGDFRKDKLAPAAVGHMAPGYITSDPRLVDMMKSMTMTKFYGRKLSKVVKEHWSDPSSGPAWGAGIRRYGRKKVRVLVRRALAEWTFNIVAFLSVLPSDLQRASALSLDWARLRRKARRQAIYTLATRYAAARADEVLDDMPDREGVEKFLLVCRRLALVAFQKERSVTLTDPLDAADTKVPATFRGKFTWNPIIYRTEKLSGEGIGPTVGIPLEGHTGDIGARSKIQNMLSPCWVHCLDSYLLSLAVLGLKKRGVTSFATVHDCIYLSERVPIAGGGNVDGLALLADVMKEAAREWFLGLGPVFEDMERYLCTPPRLDKKGRTLKPTKVEFIPKPDRWRLPWTKETYSDYVKRIKGVWEARVREIEAGAPAPTFAVKPSRKEPKPADVESAANGMLVEETV